MRIAGIEIQKESSRVRWVIASILTLISRFAGAGDPDLALQGKFRQMGLATDTASVTRTLATHPFADVRAMAAEYLRFFPDPVAWDALESAANRDENELVRAFAASALLRLDCARARQPALAVFAAVTDRSAKYVVAGGLPACGFGDGLAMFVEDSRSEDPVRSYSAVVGCGSYVHARVRGEWLDAATTCLIEATSHPNGPVRSAALSQLSHLVGSGVLTSAPAIQRLEEIEKSSPNERERTIARQALDAYRSTSDGPE